MVELEIKSITVGKWKVNTYFLILNKDVWVIDPGDDFDELEKTQRASDRWYVGFCEAMDPAALDGDLSFQAVGLEPIEYFSLPLRDCLTNLYQHQIHHRGQVHHMISHAGAYPPPVDVVKFSRGDVDRFTNSPVAAA